MKVVDPFHRRLHAQHVIGPAASSVEAVVGQLGAVQGQEYPGTNWSLGQRVAGCTDADVATAYDEGRILRTHMLRPTWHFVLPADIVWLLKLTGPRVQKLNAYMYRKLELDKKTLGRSMEVIATALEGGAHLTRPELGEALSRAGIEAAGMRLAYVAMNAELEGLDCSGSRKGKQHTYALIEERAPDARELDREESLAEIARRYFIGHGPGTVAELSRWSGLTVTDSKTALALIESELASESWREWTFWFAPDSPEPPSLQGTALLLPEFDEALIAYKHYYFEDLPRAADKQDWFDDRYYRPVIIDGRRAGVWRRTTKGKRLIFETDLFASLNAKQRAALDIEVERLAEFIGLPVDRNK